MVVRDQKDSAGAQHGALNPADAPCTFVPVGHVAGWLDRNAIGQAGKGSLLPVSQ